MGQLSLFSLVIYLGSCLAQFPPDGGPGQGFPPDAGLGGPPQGMDPQGMQNMGPPPGMDPQGQFMGPPQGMQDMGPPQGIQGMVPPQGMQDMGQPQGMNPQGMQGMMGPPQGNSGGINQPAGPFSGQIGPRELEVQAFLQSIEAQASQLAGADQYNTYMSSVDASDANAKASDISNEALGAFYKDVQDQINQRFPWWRELQCQSLWMQMRFYFFKGPGSASDDDGSISDDLSTKMTAAYNKARVCDYNDNTKCDVTIMPDLDEIFKYKRDYDELAYYFGAWYDVMSAGVSAQMYYDFVQASNRLAQSNGFQDMCDAYCDAYNDFTPNWNFQLLQQQMADNWAVLKPSYMKLHAWVRFKLKGYYGPKVSHPLGFLPGHILGDIWTQEWQNLHNITKPFPRLAPLDPTNALNAAGFTVERLFREAEKFFVEMGMFKMTPLFWSTSVVTKPLDGREMICFPQAFEGCQRRSKGTDGLYMLKMCAKVDQYYLGTVHHEMGHIEYFMHYAHLPYPFRDGANAGFHEAIGDTLDMVVQKPKHLQCALGLDMGFDCNADIGGDFTTTDADLNFLYARILQRFPVLPYAYALETWKWEVASGKITPDQYNTRFWDLKRENQGIIPPAERPAGLFDAAAKFHIVSDIEFLRYYWSDLLMYQFFQAMCVHAGEYNPQDPNTKPLHKCDFSGNRKAGLKLAKMMSRGCSKPWPDTLEEFTGSRILDPNAILNYFKPLLEYFDVQLEKAGEKPCFGLGCGPL